MTGPGFIIGLLFILSALTSLVGHWPRVRGGLWTAGALFLLWALAAWPVDRPVLVLGQPVWMEWPRVVGHLRLRVDETARLVLRLGLMAVGLWGTAAWLSPTWERGMGWLPLGILPLTVAAMLVPLWGTVWAVAILNVLLLALAQGGQPGHGQALWRWTVPSVVVALAASILLLPPDPNAVEVDTWRLWLVAGVIVTVSGLVPLHVGLTAAGEGGSPTGTVWAWWAHTLAFLVLLRRVGESEALVPGMWLAAKVLVVLAHVTLVWGGVGAVSSNNVGTLWAYAALYNWGLTVALWTTAPTSVAVLRWTLGVRMVGLGASALGLVAMEGGYPRTLARLSGWARRRPRAVAAWGLGTATLAGVPFTPGFWSQWLVHEHSSAGTLLPWISLIGGVGVALGLVRALVTLWGPLHERLLPREEGMLTVMLLAVVVGVILLGVMPGNLVRLGVLLW